MTQRKPILSLDFDGVIHSYSSGWKGADVVTDPPVPGAIPFVIQAAQMFDVCIFSSRSNEPGGIDAMRTWLIRYVSDYHFTMEREGDVDESLIQAADFVDQFVRFPTVKPPALVTLDDRAIRFTGSFPPLGELRAFQPWNKRPEADRQIDALVDDRQAQLAAFVAEIDELPNPGTSLMSHNERELIELLKRIADALR